jgi:hypothetical protein
MDRQPRNLASARKVWHLDRKLQDVAKLIEDPALDDAIFRARSRAILRERLPPEFDRRAVNASLAAAFLGRRLPTKEMHHADSYPSDR